MTQLPTKAQILEWIAQNPTLTAKRDIAKAFGIKGADRIDLKRMLKELEADGQLEKRKKTYQDPERLPPVSVMEIVGPDGNGDLFARPMQWEGSGPEPRILMVTRHSDPALGAGDRVLARLTPVQLDDHGYEGRLIRKISVQRSRMLGIYRAGEDGGRIIPIDKKSDKEWRVVPGGTGGARDGELVEGEPAGPKGRMGLPRARIVSRLGDPTAPKSVSLIAIHQHGIPDSFPHEVLEAAEAQVLPGLEGREDLRDLPLITIDPWDARDHDDACYAKADDDPENPGGFVIWVAIADVSAAVQSGSALDREAHKRGNSTYFPDRVVPMLPDTLSGDLCSLHEDIDRACIAVRMQIDAEGNKIANDFHRGLMRSHASLNYEETQEAVDGRPNERTALLLDDVLHPLFAAYAALVKARARRQPLDLDLPERSIVLNDAGDVTSVAFKDRLDAHRLIEEFMVLANVAAAETLIAKRTPLLFRVHEEPNPDKLDALRETVHSAGLTLAKGQVLQTAHLNRLLAQAADTEDAELINLATLRSMTQAYYSPANFGHFGLALQSYAHFTSPIRRYADLIVHRALISAHGWGDDGLTDGDVERLETTAEHISGTERRSMVAERDTTDRYLAAYLSERIGTEFHGRVAGIAKFGIFVKLDETGADGLVPMREIGKEYFHYDRETQTLMGADTGRVITMGMRAVVRLSEAAPVTGGIAFELLELDGKSIAATGTGAVRRTPKRKIAHHKRKADKVKRKVARRRR